MLPPALFLSFAGRIGRRVFLLALALVAALHALAIAALPVYLLTGLAGLALHGAFLWIYGALATKRLHDLDSSGKRLYGVLAGLALIALSEYWVGFSPDDEGVNAVSWFFGLVTGAFVAVTLIRLAAEPGTPEDNDYGHPPRD